MECLYKYHFFFTLKVCVKSQTSLFFFKFADDSNKSIVYTRWEKKACPIQAELIRSGGLMIFTLTTTDDRHF